MKGPMDRAAIPGAGPMHRRRRALWFHRRMDRQLFWHTGSPVSVRDAAAFAYLGVVIKTARLRLGYTQRHLERLSGVDQTTISRLENGRLTTLRLVRLAAIFVALRGAIDMGIAA
jgi:DNA-binding XRE family transcriptional regulator